MRQEIDNNRMCLFFHMGLTFWVEKSGLRYRHIFGVEDVVCEESVQVLIFVKHVGNQNRVDG